MYNNASEYGSVMASIISDIDATGRNGGDCAMSGLTNRSTTRIRIFPPFSKSRRRRCPGIALFLFFLEGIGGCHEELSSVGEGQITAVNTVQSILCEIAGHYDLGSDGQ